MAIKVGRGRATVTITGALADNLEREIREVLGPVADEIDREADIIMSRIEAMWPVKTGKSRDSWTSTLRVLPDSFRVDAAILSSLDYVRYIRSTKISKRGDAVRLNFPLQTLVRKPAFEATKRLKARLPEILGKHLQGVLDGR